MTKTDFENASEETEHNYGKKFEVINSNDEGPGSLRQAFIDSNEAESDKPNLIIITCAVIKPIFLRSEILVLKNVRLNNATSNAVTIVGSGTERIFTVDTPYFRIDGSRIVLREGKSETKGGAIFFEGNQLILQNVSLKHNAAVSGGAIYTTGQLIVSRCSIKKNEAQLQGGGLWLGNGGTIYKTSIKYNKITRIDSSGGGGGIFKDDGTLTVSHSSIDSNFIAYKLTTKEENGLGGSGGGIASMAGDIWLARSTVKANQSYNSPGILQGVGNITVEDDSHVDGNQSFNTGVGLGAGGGGITIILGSVYVSGSTISFNKGQAMYSSGIVSLIGDIVVANDSVLEENSNNGPGGAIACNFDGSICISGKSKIIKNTGASLGGGIVNFSLNLGLISVSENSIVSNNILTNAQTIGQTIEAFLETIFGQLDEMALQASLSGGSGSDKFINALPDIKAHGLIIKSKLDQLPEKIDGINRNKLVGGGGIAGLLTCPIFVSNDSIISSNLCGKNVSDEASLGIGGGIFGLLNTLNLTRASILSNYCSQNGGGVWLGGRLTASSSTIKENLICSIKESRVDHLKRTSKSIEESSPKHTPSNKYPREGAGILISANGSATLTKILITHNKIVSSEHNSLGGGLSNHSPNLIILDSSIEDNIASHFPNIYSKFPFFLT